MANRQRLSIIVPVHNEAANLMPLYEALIKVTGAMPYQYELLFVDDGSQDDSLVLLENLAQRDRKVRIIEFARNFGKEAAVSAGLHHAKGDAAIILDADLQHPPAVIPSFVSKWRQGADVVIGVRKYGKGEGLFKRFASRLFYKLASSAGAAPVVPDASDFRLIDRRVIKVFNRLTEHNRMTRALLDWLGFRRAYVHFEAAPRLNGKAGYSFRKLFGLAINSVTAHSLLPLKVAGYLGLVILISSGALGAFMYIEKYILGDPYNLQFTGTALLAVLIVFLVGLILACLGLVTMYIARIHAEVANRPLYIVRKHTALLPDEEGEA